MHLKRLLADRATLLEWFIWSNLGFLAVDIYVAHKVNDFHHWAEWIPLFFSLIAPCLLLPSLRRGHHLTSGKTIGLVVGWFSIAIGIAGLFFHLESQFFKDLTIKSLVYTAPFVAPLAYTGIGFLLLLNRMVPNGQMVWGGWVVFLAAGGWLGNFILSAADHAQNGFFVWVEWVSVIGSGFAVSFLFLVPIFFQSRGLIRVSQIVMLCQVILGLSGFALHVHANWNSGFELTDAFLFGAPVFAPLLFVDLALLALLGLEDLWQKTHARSD